MFETRAPISLVIILLCVFPFQYGIAASARGDLSKFQAYSANPCSPNPCYNSGRCIINDSNGYICNCPPSHEGDRCEIRKRRELCDSSPCQNGGTCFVNTTSNMEFSCICRVGYGGKYCEKADSCYPNPCLNNGTCYNRFDGGYNCSCKRDYYGKRCENVTDSVCKHVTCWNGGTCHETWDGRFICTCTPYHTGSRCQFNNTCYPNPCENGGNCTVYSNYYYNCTCLFGFWGNECQYGNFCRNITCKNGGTCVSYKGGSNCICGPKFSGRYCEYDIYRCRYNPCKNGGTCVSNVTSVECVCSKGFTGSYCEYPSDESDPSFELNVARIQMVNVEQLYARRGFPEANATTTNTSFVAKLWKKLFGNWTEEYFIIEK